jgi:hypothetical protein
MKVITLIARKPGLSRGEFMEHYETSHAPLAAKVFPSIVQYRRNFIDLTDAIIAPGAQAVDFDSVTELWYSDRAGYDAMLNTHFTTDIGKTIEDDERKFLNQSTTRFFHVEQRGMNHPDKELGSAAGGTMFKAIAFLTRKPGMPQKDFVDYYENQHSKLIWSLFPWIVEYRRNFIDMKDAIMAPAAPALDFDVVTELWFADRSGYDKMLAAHANPEVGGAVARDEENCFDRTKTRFFAVEERGGPIAGR